MLPKHQKLTGKDINYMLKRGKRYYGEYLIFRVIPQYPNNKYHQRAFQISLKVDKRASMRNLMKRSGYACARSLTAGAGKKYVKIFASVNKKKAQELKELIATQNKNTIVKKREEHLHKDLTFLFRNLS